MNRDMFKRKMHSYHHADYIICCYLHNTSALQHKAVAHSTTMQDSHLQANTKGAHLPTTNVPRKEPT